MVNANVYQLQDAFFDAVTLVANAAEKLGQGTILSVKRISLTANQLGLMGSNCDEGDFVAVNVKIASMANDSQMVASHQLVDNARRDDLLEQLVFWTGTAMLHNGETITDPENPTRNISFLFPQTQELIDIQESGDEWKGHETILLVDDEDMIWDVIIDMLSELDTWSSLPRNGQEAIDIYKGNPGGIDLVLMDMVMPVMNARKRSRSSRKSTQRSRSSSPRDSSRKKMQRTSWRQGQKDSLENPIASPNWQRQSETSSTTNHNDDQQTTTRKLRQNRKVLGRGGIASRRRCEELIAEGRVTVNDTPILTPATFVDPAK
jgi:CheY-like chemotaxis protein